MSIEPSDIDTGKHFFGAFGKDEREVSARWIVRYCQHIGEWQPFTLAELQAWYDVERARKGWRQEEFWFNGLDSPQWLRLEDGRYHVTPLFIALCYQASPAK